MISKYSEFIIENLINESIVYFTPKLTKILNLVKSDISNELLDVQGEDIKSDVTLIDIGDEGYLSFTTMKNAKKNISIEYPNLVDGDENKDVSIKPNIDLINSLYVAAPHIFTKSRNPVKIGRLINTLLPGKFNDKEIEIFVNKFKSFAYDKGEVFRIVSGEEITTWYSALMYKGNSGSLGGSCMKNSSKSIFQIYVENPEVCRLLILVDDNKLIGRALIWKIKGIDGCEYFLDRQYTLSDKYVETFRNYAIDKGWAYKTKNNHSSIKNVTYKDKSFDVEMTIELNDLEYKRYPYMDTFKNYVKDKSVLANKSRENAIPESYLLESTTGEFDVISSGSVWSDYYEDYMDRDESIWSDVLDSFIYEYDSVRVSVGSLQGIYPDGHDQLVWDAVKSRYLHENDCVWSDKYDNLILSDEAVSVIMSIIDDGNIDEVYLCYENDRDINLIDKKSNWYKKVSEYDESWKAINYIIDDIISIDYKSNQMLDIFSVIVYEVIDEYLNDIYLQIEDAKMFNIEINKDSYRIIDLFEYYENIKKYGTKLNLFRNKPIITFDKLVKKLKKNGSSDLKNIELYNL